MYDVTDIGNAIYYILSTDVHVSAVVGTRIFSSTLPQGITQPSISYSVRPESRDYHMSGPSGLKRDRIQIYCWAQNQDNAVELANHVKNVLSGFSGAVDPASIIVRGMFHVQGRDIYDSAAKLYTRQRDYVVWYVIDTDVFDDFIAWGGDNLTWGGEGNELVW